LDAPERHTMEKVSMNAIEKLSPAMSEAVSDIRKRSWKTRREKYGERGHGGAYCHPKPIYTRRWNERLNSMQGCLIRLYRQGVLSEGQVSKATGLDRVSCRDLAIQQAEGEQKVSMTDIAGVPDKRTDVYEIHGGEHARSRGWDFTVCRTIRESLDVIGADLDALEEGEELRIVYQKYSAGQMEEVVFDEKAGLL